MQIIIWIPTVIGILLAFLAFWIYREKQWLAEQLERQKQSVRNIQTELRQLERHHQKKTEECRQTEDKLRTYLQLLDTLINTIPNPIFYMDVSGIYRGCNQAFAKTIIGLTRDRIIGKKASSFSVVIPPDTVESWEGSHTKNGRLWGFEAEVISSDGLPHDFLFNIAMLTDGLGTVVGSIGVMMDLTERNRAAKDRMQKEKLKGVLETAGAVCHEFNQPLQALMGYLELAMELSAEKNSNSEWVGKILVQVERMAQITDKLQGITRYETMMYTDQTKIIDIHKSSRN
ncbi:MAG: PAS domain S-box protein [Desulfobacteraceae bacterium]|jgi:PAS domain S-box-containing protein